MFDLIELEKKLASFLVVLTEADRQTVTEIATELNTINPDKDTSGFLFSDERCLSLAQGASDIAKSGVDITPLALSRWCVARRRYVFGKDFATAEKAITEFVTYERGTEKPNLKVAQFLISELDRIATRRDLLTMSKKLEDLAATGIGNPSDVYAQMQARLGESMPSASHLDALTGDQLDAVWIKEMALRKLLTENKVPFITLPKKLGLSKNITRLKPGDMTLITAPTKAGKTSLALELAKHVSLAGNGWLHVIYFHAETSSIDLNDRLVSSHTGIEMETLREGEANDLIQNAIKEISAWKQHVTFNYCHKARPDQITQQVRRFAARLPKWHSLLVIIDYVDHDKLDFSHYKTENTAYQIGSAFSEFRACAEQCTWQGDRGGSEQTFKGFVHVLCFQQESGEGLARGSRSGSMYSQNYIRMYRTVATKTIEVTGVFNFGKPIPEWGPKRHVQKGEDAPYAVFQVIATNDGYPGAAYVAVDKFKFLFDVAPEAIRDSLEEKEFAKKKSKSNDW